MSIGSSLGRAARAFVSLALLSVPLAAQNGGIPTPESVLGFAVGADYKLATYDESIAYFRKLAEAAPDRVKLVDVGRTSEGRAWTLVILSSAANIASLERYREIAQRLAHPAGLTDEEARRLAREGKAFVDISGGLHASEVAGAQHTLQLAYDLLTRTDDRTRRILDETVLLLWPSINPDGQNIVVDWYRRNVGTPYETAPLNVLYQKYIGHDNNRDAYMLNVVESRVVARTWRHWEPQIIYVQHQTSPFPTRIWLPPFAEPIAPRVPALMSREVNTIGMTIAQALESEGKPGATHMGTGFDAWYPGYVDYMPMLQNIAAFWTETALWRYATPRQYTIEDFPRDMRDLRPQSLYPSPWAPGWWRLRDAVDYMETASIATLDYAAKYREDLLYNRYQAGRNAIARYRKEAPYAYVVPQAQRDPGAAAEMLRRLAFNGVRVSQLARDASLDGTAYPRGTWVIPMDQEFAELVRQLFERQTYPDLREYPEGPPEQPYDAAGWTLPLQMGVAVVEVKSPIPDDARAALAPVRGTPASSAAPDAPFATDAQAAGITPPAGRVAGSGPHLAVSPAQNDAFRLITRALAAKGTVRYDPARARYLLSGVPARTLDAWAVELGLRAERTAAPRESEVVRPRIGIYRPWTASMDEGWTEWLLDTHGFAYTPLTNADIRAGGPSTSSGQDLAQRFDVILIAADAPRTIAEGFAASAMPAPYAGGLGPEGAAALDAFVRGGGTLVALGQGTGYAISALKLPVKDVTAGLARKDYFSSGSILEVVADTTQRVMAGMPARASVFVDRSPVFDTLPGFQGAMLARFDTAGTPLQSGYLLGEKFIQGKAAALEVRHERGRVVLIGFRPQWRGQPFGTFRVVMNAVLSGSR